MRGRTWLPWALVGALWGCGDGGTPPEPPGAGGLDSLLVATVPIPPAYGIHDTYVRDGLAFVSAWDTGLLLYDVGNGMAGGTPAAPVPVGGVATAGGNVHNAWWDGSGYVFVGEEGPASIGSRSTGDVHVVDASDLTGLVEVASYHHNDTSGTHNFWMDEANRILYAAYYNAGVVALDVSGTLTGDLTARRIAQVAPGGDGNTFTWGVQLHTNGYLYAIDMLSGLWQLSAATLEVVGGGNNVPERASSDLWLHGSYAYTGTWGSRNGNDGNAVKVWRLDAAGAPVLVDSVVQAGIGTVSDLQVTPDGTLLVFSAEGGSGAGLYVYGLADPARPQLVARALVGTGLHTVTLGVIGGRTYAFAAKNPAGPALLIYDITSLIP